MKQDKKYVEKLAFDLMELCDGLYQHILFMEKNDNPDGMFPSALAEAKEYFKTKEMDECKKTIQ